MWGKIMGKQSLIDYFNRRIMIALFLWALLLPILASCGGGGAESAPIPSGSGSPAPDTTSPSVINTTTSAVLQNTTNADPILMTVTFSEPVTGFDITDIVVVNGGKGNLAGSGSTYTFEITPTGDPTSITADIAAGAVQDGAGNPSLAAAQFTIFFNSTFDPLNNPPIISDITDKFTNQDTLIEFILFTADEGLDPLEDPESLSVAGVTSSDQTLVQDANITVMFTDNGAGDGGSGELAIMPEPDFPWPCVLRCIASLLSHTPS